MSAAFALDPTGPPVPCDFPGCTLDSFHEGDHLLAEKPKPVSGARRFRCSQCNRECVIYGERIYGSTETCGEQACLLSLALRSAEPLPLRCRCPQRPYAHDLSVHLKLRSESYNPKLRFTYPWSLMLSKRVEPSTEVEDMTRAQVVLVWILFAVIFLAFYSAMHYAPPVLVPELPAESPH